MAVTFRTLLLHSRKYTASPRVSRAILILALIRPDEFLWCSVSVYFLLSARNCFAKVCSVFLLQDSLSSLFDHNEPVVASDRGRWTVDPQEYDHSTAPLRYR